VLSPTICAAFPFAAGAALLGVRAANADTRSRRLAAAATACGVAGFIPVLLAATFKDPDQSAAVAGCGVVTLLFAVTAVLLAVCAFRARRRDQGVNGLVPLAGLACGAVNLFCGTGALIMGVGVLTPAGGTPWTWRSAEHGFEVTVPTEDWVIKPSPNVLVKFTCSRPPLVATVIKAVPAETDAEYEAALAEWTRIRNGSPTDHPEERAAPNRYGNPYRVYTGDAPHGDRPYFFGMSVTHVRGKAVLLMLEGPYRMTSEVGHAQEARAFRAQADEFLGSVR
jgi:hypothetical protein